MRLVKLTSLSSKGCFSFVAQSRRRNRHSHPALGHCGHTMALVTLFLSRRLASQNWSCSTVTCNHPVADRVEGQVAGLRQCREGVPTPQPPCGIAQFAMHKTVADIFSRIFYEAPARGTPWPRALPGTIALLKGCRRPPLAGCRVSNIAARTARTRPSGAALSVRCWHTKGTW